MHYSLKADISILWKAEANLTQYHPLGHVISFEEYIYLCIPIASALYIFIVYLLPPFDKLAELCSSLLALCSFRKRKRESRR